MFLYLYSIGSANSSVGRASDCSYEGCWFESDLVDIKTSFTQLVECQPHELKVVGSILTRGVSCFISIFLAKFSCTTFSILIFSLSLLNKFCETSPNMMLF